MSNNEVTKFFQLVAADPDLRKAVRAAAAKGAGAGAALEELGAVHGCVFTVEEFNRVASVFHQQLVGGTHPQELADDP